jgi:hypothetical protein
MTSVEKLDLASIEAAIRGLIWVLTEHAKGESP